MSSQLHDLVSAYAVGSLDLEDRMRFEEHLRECAGCRAELRVQEEVAAELGAAVAAEPPASLRERLMGSLRGAPRRPGLLFKKEGILISRSEELKWQSMGPGVEFKTLHTDSTRRYSTMLIRMAAGARLPKHRHADIEEVFMISGDFHVAGMRLGPGDYCHGDTGSTHEETYTESGAMFLLMASHANELLA